MAKHHAFQQHNSSTLHDTFLEGFEPELNRFCGWLIEALRPARVLAMPFGGEGKSKGLLLPDAIAPGVLL